MNVAVLLLCHEPPQLLARRLSMAFYRDPAVKLYIHYDANRPAADFAALKQRLPADARWQLLEQRVACRWGEYSLVEATRRLMKAAVNDEAFHADYLLLCSGSCVPIRPLASLQAFLKRRRGIDFIQAHDIRHGRWIKDGLQEERYQYYFPLNFLTHRKAFDRLTALQRRLGVRRRMPEGLQIHFGSQWFCLTRATSAAVVSQFERPGLADFFRRSWIPDEFAIQTLVAAVQKPAFIAGYSLTYYEFDGEGRPLVLDNGHEDHLARQPFFMARKIAPEALDLHEKLEARVAGRESDFSYFDRVGRPTLDYQRFLADVMLNRAPRSAIGTIVDPWRGPMDSSRRRYYVVVASSRRYLHLLLQQARSGGQRLPVFDFPFDRRRTLIAVERGRHYGLQASDRARRDHDPAAYLFELVHVDPSLPAAFGLDPAYHGWVRDFVRWDANAVVVNCDPHGLTTEQRAAATMADADADRDGELLLTTRRAALESKPLPRDLTSLIGGEGEHACHLLRLVDADYDRENPVVRALFEAARAIDASAFFPAPETASRTVWG